MAEEKKQKGYCGVGVVVNPEHPVGNGFAISRIAKGSDLERYPFVDDKDGIVALREYFGPDNDRPFHTPKTNEEWLDRMRGEAGTELELQIYDAQTDTVKTVTAQRKGIFSQKNKDGKETFEIDSKTCREVIGELTPNVPKSFAKAGEGLVL